MADDWLDTALRLGLCLGLVIPFGISLLGVQMLRLGHRVTAIARQYVRAIGITAALDIVLSLRGFIATVKTMTRATEYAELTNHVFNMVLTTTAVGLVWMARLVALTGCSVTAVCLRKHPASRFGVYAELGAMALLTITWAGHRVMDNNVKGYPHLTSDIMHTSATGA